MGQHYSAEEDLIILENIAKYPENLQFSFLKSAESINKSAKSICARYYRYLRNNPNNCAFVMMSEKKLHSNSKVIYKDDLKHRSITHKSLWQIIKETLFRHN